MIRCASGEKCRHYGRDRKRKCFEHHDINAKIYQFVDRRKITPSTEKIYQQVAGQKVSVSAFYFRTLDGDPTKLTRKGPFCFFCAQEMQAEIDANPSWFLGIRMIAMHVLNQLEEARQARRQAKMKARGYYQTIGDLVAGKLPASLA